MTEVREPVKKTSIEKKEKIIEKGFELLCEKGFHNVSSIDIARYAGVSTGCIYQYFSDKKAIFVEGAKLYLKNICFPLLEVFEEYKEKEISVEKFVSLVLERSIEKQNLSRNAHQELMSMCCLDEEIQNIFNQNELEVTKEIESVLQKKNFSLKNSKERMHLFIHIVDDYSHEMIYHKHPEYDYHIMYEETKKILIHLLKGDLL